MKHREKHIDGWLGETGNLQVFDLEDFYLANAYVPYSNAADEKWIKIRQRWDKDFHDLLCSLSKEKPLVV